MSAFIVEDGTGLAAATSYVAEDEAASLLAETQYESLFDQLTEPSQALMRATAWLDNRFRWYGEIRTDTQALQWPRTKNYDSLGKVIPAGTIPKELKLAVAIAAVVLTQDSADTVTASGERGPVKSWSGDGMAISYGDIGGQDPQAYLMGKRYPDIEFMLRAIGKFKDVEWMQTNLITVVKQ